MGPTKKIFHHAKNDKQDKDGIASTSSDSHPRNSKTLLDPNSFSVQSSSPPPYTEVDTEMPFRLSAYDEAFATQRYGKVDETQAKDSVAASQVINQSDSKGAHPGPSHAHPSVKLCPHESLSFERIQSVVEQLCHQKRTEIDILQRTNEEEPRHAKDEYATNTPWVCEPDEDSFLTRGAFTLEINRKWGWYGRVIGVKLRIQWEIKLGSYDSNRNDTRIYLQKLGNISLCPHMTIDDPKILDLIYKKSKPAADPLIPTRVCFHCNTHIEVSKRYPSCRETIVKVVRQLGTGVSKNDPTWLAQCGVDA